MTGVIERNRWRLYDLDGSRYPLRSAGCGIRKAGWKKGRAADRLYEARPAKFYSCLNGLMLVRPAKPEAAVQIALRRVVRCAWAASDE